MWQETQNTDHSVEYQSRAASPAVFSILSAHIRQDSLTLTLTFNPEQIDNIKAHFALDPSFGLHKKHAAFVTSLGNHLCVSLDYISEKAQALNFMQQVIELDASLAEILPQFKQFINLMDFYQLESIIKTTYKTKGLDEALLSAYFWHAKGYKQSFIVLANLLFALNKPDEGILVLNKLPYNDPIRHYDAALILIKHNYLDAALHHLLHAGDNPLVQALRDNIWAQQTVGDSGAAEYPKVSKVKLNDSHTLYQLCEQVKNLNELLG